MAASSLAPRLTDILEAIERDGESGNYVVATDGGEKIVARNVVVATGLYQTPKIPALSGAFPPEIKQLHSDLYRNPERLAPGAVLVVGSAQSGAQIAEELYESGRKVFLAVGRAGQLVIPSETRKLRLEPGKRAVINLTSLDVATDAYVVVTATGPVVVDREASAMPGVTVAAAIPDVDR